MTSDDKLEARHIPNPHMDYVNEERTPIEIDEHQVKMLICTYVNEILEGSKPRKIEETNRFNLYVGNAGIAYMFWKMSRSEKTKDLFPCLELARGYIRNARVNADRNRYKTENTSLTNYAFLLGRAGTYAVSAVIAKDTNNASECNEDLIKFKMGIGESKKFSHTDFGCDEVLVGRAGYLAGCYWLNEVMREKIVKDSELLQICQTIMKSGRAYAKKIKAPFPLMFQYHGKEYLGAAHGLCSILLMLLDSPWFRSMPPNAPTAELHDIKLTLDYFLTLQDADGNFPISLDDLKNRRDKRLVHWCHGAPGAAYLFARAHILFNEDKYMKAFRRIADLIWEKGLLRKGPGLCHGIAGNGYVFLLAYRLTHEQKYLYRAAKFMKILSSPDIRRILRTPDRPLSLYEGLAGTVCFLIDIIEPESAQFPFMDVFH